MRIKIIGTIAFASIVCTSVAGAVPLTYKGEATLVITDQSTGKVTNTIDLGPCFNVGDATGWNSGTRDHDHGPQIAFIDPFGLGPTPVPWNCASCY